MARISNEVRAAVLAKMGEIRKTAKVEAKRVMAKINSKLKVKK